MPIAQLIIALLSSAPQAISEITALYNSVKTDLSLTDQASVEGALAAAQTSDANATDAADAALLAASSRS